MSEDVRKRNTDCEDVLPLPVLPTITSSSILQQVFTHRSLHGRPNHLFEDFEDDPAPDNEQLEHLGDTVLQLCVTNLIRDMYPRLRVGPATKVRSEVVGNTTLAILSVKYNLPTILRMHPVQALTLQKSTKLQADLFESYIGGVFVTRGIEVVQKWLSHLLKPFVKIAYKKVRREYCLPNEEDSLSSLDSFMSTTSTIVISTTCPDGDPEMISLEKSFNELGLTSPMKSLSLTPALPPQASSPLSPELTKGYLSLFNQYVQQHKNTIQWEWTDSKVIASREGPTWCCLLKVDGEHKGTGRSRTKKAAMNEAAAQALQAFGVQIQ